MLLSTRARNRLVLVCLIALAVCASGCGAGTVSATPTDTPGATATSASPCPQLIPNATLANGVSGVPGIQLPSGTYSGAATASGGGIGQYTVQTYALCFRGQEPAIDGGLNPPSSSSSSTLGNLVQGGWVLNNLFPDPTSVANLDTCASGHTCLNTSGLGNPFAFVGADQFASQSGGYTTFRLQVATIIAPSCLNDPTYYSGTPQYMLFEDSATATASTSGYPDHFQMPPGTVKSSFLGGGTAGSTYSYFCSAGTQSSVNAFLMQSMQNAGYAEFGGITGGCFTENKGTNPTYSIQVCVTNPNNYYLRIFVPI